MCVCVCVCVSIIPHTLLSGKKRDMSVTNTMFYTPIDPRVLHGGQKIRDDWSAHPRKKSIWQKYNASDLVSFWFCVGPWVSEGDCFILLPHVVPISTSFGYKYPQWSTNKESSVDFVFTLPRDLKSVVFVLSTCIFPDITSPSSLVTLA